MLFGNNYENSLRGAGNAAQATTQMAPEERAAGLLRAMRQAHGVAAKMRYFGEPGASGAVAAADALEITWRTARDMPDHPKLADMTMSAARNCRAMAGYLPSRVNDQARQQASERASHGHTGHQTDGPPKGPGGDEGRGPGSPARTQPLTILMPDPAVNPHPTGKMTGKLQGKFPHTTQRAG